MRTFKEPNLSADWVCPICNTSKKKEVVLIGIVGTEEGNNMQAEQFHFECIELLWDKEVGLLYQRVAQK